MKTNRLALRWDRRAGQIRLVRDGRSYHESLYTKR
jgi:hypothetical protein